jgi:hypothetical protein
MVKITVHHHRNVVKRSAADWFHRQPAPVSEKPVRTVTRKGHAPRVRRPNATR